ncbi:hypothetical protein SEA_LUMOS_120 [Mycobacterium phage Lumos]|uniref:Uncharacterized protein n=1 Tax=Mycobacterium phage Lumos TaxID=1701852 RepID=A0A0K2CLW7_9CAUD|nr:hypothetical protein AVU96_gp070 [Mycobacterium phage Snenia]YP_010012568.1 hypothetical protein J4T93_gp068 [Mycobacterium phage Lumos]ASM62847.1 hypothetical protein SEA_CLAUTASTROPHE_119 [Mycobacterium phage Clautastrophe]QDF16694.1 hypothetical protein PBI_MSGREEN_121 [Mycobacterium phage MsGreen]QPL14994.1 hypothetical protein SEA_JUBIE_120 [Mycobacterium phage Jubie]ALA06626.1 hypothetical protein SEA_LUMOS_120 [Mycobacterium phage Lumos]ALF01565.1 hypothetical protein SNENIA_119 [My
MTTSQQLTLTALQAEVDRLVSEGVISETVYDHLPQSHTFIPEAGECWDEDDIAAIKAVGEADVAAKIAYLARVIDANTVWPED